MRQSSCQPGEFLPRIQALNREPIGGSDLSPESAPVGAASVSDARLLYCTSVNDGALPTGYEAEFEGVMRTVEPAAKRQARAHAQLKPEALSLLRLRAARRSDSQTVSGQLGPRKPRRFRTKFERTLHAGHKPRKDEEEEERTRWIHELAHTTISSWATCNDALLCDAQLHAPSAELNVPTQTQADHAGVSSYVVGRL